jgi:hypothetical protein
MASNYAAFPVKYRTAAGELESVGAGVSVKCRKLGAGSDLAESPLTTDSNGEIASGSFSATTAGDVVHFRVENLNGLAGTYSQETT